MGKSKDIATRTFNSNLGIGTSSPDEKLHVEGSILVDAFNAGNETGIFFREGFTSSNKYNHSILAYDTDGSPDGISINGYGGVSICTGSNSRQERFKVDSSGIVTKPYNPWFDAKGTGGWTTLAQYENILNVFNGGTVYQNSGGGFNSSTSTYTAPVSGRYCFLYNTYTKGGSTSTAARYLYPRLYVNNSPKQPRENIQHYNGENADEGRENTIMIDLAANDTVKAGVWSSHTDNQYYGSSFHLQMFFIG